MHRPLDNSCVCIDSEYIPYHDIDDDIKKDISDRIPIQELRRKYPEFIFEYIKEKPGHNYEIRKQVNENVWLCAKWRTE